MSPPHTPPLETPPPAELALPPENPSIRIPLRGAVELITDEAAENAIGPHEVVDAFLATNAEIFGSVEDAWVTVKRSHDSYSLAVNEIRGTGDGKKRASRETRRRFESLARDLLSTNAVFGTGRYQAQEIYPGARSKLDKEKPLEDSNDEFVNRLKEMWDELDKHLDDALETQQLPERTHASMLDLNRKKLTITIANLYALYRQEIALGKLRSFLEAGPTITPVFTERLQELAQSKDEVREYPGLLELLAVHVEEEPRSNMLWAAIQKSAPEPAAYAQEFWLGAGARDLPKELTAALGVMEIAADLVEGELSYDRAAFMRLFASQSHRWPTELAAKLTEFANGKTMETWTALQSALKPYMRPGRLPAVASTKNMTTPGHKRTGRDLGKPTSGSNNSTNKGTANVLVSVARKGGEYSDVMLDTTEHEPISHFAILMSTGDKAGMHFKLDDGATSLEDVFDHSNLRDYVEKHQHDKTIEPMLRAALEHLTKRPKDPAHTTRLSQGEYSLVLENGSQDRIARRFSPKHFRVPDLRKKGEIASKTRIIYDVLNHNGHLTLVVYGAFIKQDVEDWLGRGLPRLR